jgi:hypothetical protein
VKPAPPRKRDAVTPPDVLRALLTEAGDSAVLVGGQALAIWVFEYGLALPSGVAAITNDTDFLAQSPTATDLVRRLARTISGQAVIPPMEAITALVGQAVRDVSETEALNVDVLFKVIGLRAQDIRARSVVFDSEYGRFLAMHPIDVLRSRLANVYQLPEKQDAKGQTQLGLAVDVARAYLRSEAATENRDDVASGRSALQPIVTEIEQLARQRPGQKVAERFAIHVADAIDPSLIPAGPFWDKKWPQLRQLMSEAYAAQFTPPFAPKSPA